jgi:hypothetical protein
MTTGNQTVYSDAEWGLLVGLPQAVATAASAAESDGSRRTRTEGVAGLEAIAAGRESGSQLVEDVALELVSRVGDPEQGDEPPVISPADPQAVVASVIDRARAAAVLLAEKADEGEAAAYKHWLVSIAEQVVTAAPSGGILGIGGEQVSESERQFRDSLAEILQD